MPTPNVSIDNRKENVINEGDDPYEVLKGIKLRNVNRLTIAHLNINSIRNKFHPLSKWVKGNLDICVITETKIDSSFPWKQFDIEGYTQYRFNRDCLGGGVIIYIREDIPCRELKNHPQSTHIEGIFLEINLRKTKWLLFGGYNPKKSNIDTFLGYVGEVLDYYMQYLDNFLLLGDFNAEINEKPMSAFCDTYNLKNIVTGPTCFKNPTNPSSVDLILTNKYRSFTDNINLESGLSDFHLLTTCTMRSVFPKQSPIRLTYRSYKKFDNILFRKDLEYNLLCLSEYPRYEEFESIFIEVLNKHAPLKEKFVRANNSPFMNKALTKAIMERSKLKNIFNRNPNDINETNYKKQRNYCVNLLRRVKKEYYNNLNPKNITDNKTFWNSVKPFFSDKNKSVNKITLIENGTIIDDDNNVAETFNEFFSNVVERMHITGFIPEPILDNSTDLITNCIQKFQNHPSITHIKDNIITESMFQFSGIKCKNMEVKINNLNVNKPTTYNNVPAKIIAENKDICSLYLHEIYNNTIMESNFPSSMKNADITPVHKKGDKTDKQNYRPVSILSSFSKLFEKNMCDDINQYMNSKLSPYLCGFRKGYSTEYCLIIMLEKWKKALDKHNFAGALLTDLSKAFDCLNHELLIAKLEAYGFHYSALKFIMSYLSNRTQRTKVNNSFSQWADIKSGVPQGSILGPLLFNIYINDIFYFVDEKKVANYADDTTPYAINKNIENLLDNLQFDSDILLVWFENNFLKLNPDKCKLLITSNANDVGIRVGNEIIEAQKSVNLLGIKIDNDLKFTEHVTTICNKANIKLHALARVSHFMDKEKLRVLMKAFILSQFEYCPLIWMFHSRSLNNKINRLHERALRLVYKDNNLSFSELLEMDNSFTIHHINLQKLATEMYKIKNNISPCFMKSIFPLSYNIYDLRHNSDFKRENIRTVTYGSETISYRGPEIWELVPNDIKQSLSLDLFKKQIKQWKPIGCQCRICKIYIANVGFIN